MCVIAVSKKGIRQPSESELRSMWEHNPHGAGYMTIRNKKVEIHKGFTELKDFLRSVRSEHFSTDNPVIYHFRISTQAGITPQMTHPFPLTSDLSMMKELDLRCNIGIAHNGIIPLTSSATEREYSDTALFIAKYMTLLIRSASEINNPYVHKTILELSRSKFAIMNKYGDIATIGKFYNHDGVLLSNEYHLIPAYTTYPTHTYTYTTPAKSF